MRLDQIEFARGIAYTVQQFTFPTLGGELRLFDVADAGSPVALGALSLEVAGSGLAVADGFAHVSGPAPGLFGDHIQAVDVRVPGFPRRQVVEDPRLRDADLASAGDRLYAVGRDVLQVLDVREPLEPVLLGSVAIAARTLSDVEVTDGTAYVTGRSGDLLILDVADAAQPRVVSTLSFPLQEFTRYPEVLQVAGNHLYVGTVVGFLEIYDIFDPHHPVRIGALTHAPTGRSIDLDLGDGLLWLTGSAGLRGIDVSDPSAPRELGRFDNPYSPFLGFGRAAVAGDVVYLEPGFFLELAILDVSDPTQPSAVGLLFPSARDLEVVSDRLFVGSRRVYDISQPMAPALMGARLGEPDSRIEVSGSVVYAGLESSIEITDFGPEYLPTLEPEIDVSPFDPRDRVVVGQQRPLAVGLLGSAQLAVRDVDSRSLLLGPGRAPARHAFRTRLNRDDHEDLVAFFWTPDTGLALGDAQLCLSGRTRDGRRLRGCDAIRTLAGCGRGFELALLVPLLLPLGHAFRRSHR